VGTEFSDSALTNHSIPSTALTTTTTQDGDYLVIEIGRTGGLGQADMRIGDAATSDLPENETTTDDLNPWIEFDSLIVPLVGVEETTYEVQSETVNGATQFYIEDSTSVAAYGRRERVLVFKDILALGLTQADLTAASATLYALAVTYLLRHKDPQVAYEVDVVGLEHISGGVPTFKSGQTVRLDYEGTIETEDGREALISVDTDLYVMGYTRRFDDAGGSHWRFTVSTVARELPSDGQIFSDMMREIGVAKIAPLGDLTVGPANGAHIQLNSDGSFEIVGQSVRLTDDGLSLEVASDPDITGEAERKIRHTNDGFETAYGERYGARVDGLNSNYLVDRVFKATDSYLLRGVWNEATEAYDVSEFLAQSDTGFSEFWSINVGNATALGLRRIAADDFELYMLIGGAWTKIAG
jgi:hypothetical protein